MNIQEVIMFNNKYLGIISCEIEAIFTVLKIDEYHLDFPSFKQPCPDYSQLT